MNKDQEEERTVTASERSEGEGELIFGPGMDGMGTFTAKMAIDRKLRKELLENYDLVEVVNKGRYYTAKALSKDGQWVFELLVDKQRGSLEIVSKTKSGAAS
ncbi:MAG: hypothetical protein CVU57_28225 [Deltaproteobacteria bacterium HGW-Deltaproteobacteria-15]|jgi:hypothetical protein|nr:MAG: hypothetical protein CVU57_28225 [Deltaproteobacteria bacterium HGW-Deltaproteobacteria-15]